MIIIIVIIIIIIAQNLNKLTPSPFSQRKVIFVWYFLSLHLSPSVYVITTLLTPSVGGFDTEPGSKT